MARRIPLRKLEALVLAMLDEERWTTATSIADELRLGHGREWERISLVLERAANDERIEMKGRGTRVRRFRSPGAGRAVFLSGSRKMPAPSSSSPPEASS